MVLWPSLGSGSEGYGSLAFLMDQVVATCEAEAVRCVDLRPVLRPYADDGRLRVSQFDAHPNGLANELASAAVLAAFESDWRAAAARKRLARPGGPPRSAAEAGSPR
jgi:hypothetical protein